MGTIKNVIAKLVTNSKEVKEIEQVQQVQEVQEKATMEGISKKDTPSTKQIHDATMSNKILLDTDFLEGEDIDGDNQDASNRFDAEETGEVNAPPLQFTEEELEAFNEQEAEKDKQRLEIKSKTETYGNGSNVWRLISKTYNDFLGYEHVTTAMQIGEKGVLVCVKEAIGQKSDSTVCFIPGAKLEMRPSVDEFREPSYDQDGKLIQKWTIL